MTHRAYALKWILLSLLSVLFNSCATTGSAFITATYLTMESTQYAKALGIREKSDVYILEYTYSYIAENLASLRSSETGYGRKFIAMDSNSLGRLCRGDSLPTFFRQELNIDRALITDFEKGSYINPKSIGCTSEPTFQIVDSGKFKKPARVALIGSGLIIDALLIAYFPVVYVGIVVAGSIIGLVALASILPNLH
jgi:hypothetical protein